MSLPGRREPVTIKHTTSGENDRFEYAVSSMQGGRLSNEDAHATIEDLDVSTATSLFGVYDGHGGRAVSNYCAEHFHQELLKHRKFCSDPSHALERTFFRMDKLMRTKKALKELTVNGNRDYCAMTAKNKILSSLHLKKPPGPLDEGSTACVALIRGNQIIVGNAGDSRCVLSRNGQAIALSTDHKPSVPAERQRIRNAGSYVNIARGAHRIDNGIAVSRSIGDLKYKKNKHLTPERQALTCCPDIRVENITDGDEFLVLACDGIWDVMGNQDVVGFVRMRMEFGRNLGSICEALLDRCVERSTDNMTVILVRFKDAPAQAVLPAGLNLDANCQIQGVTSDDEHLARQSNPSLESGVGSHHSRNKSF